LSQAIGDMLPSAIGVAISPIPIIAVVLMLVTERARSNGPAFVAGWWLGVGVLLAIILVATGDTAGEDEEDEPGAWLGWVELAIGAGLVALALQQWRGRGEHETPKWMDTLDSFTPVKALGAAVLLSAVNPKNLILVVAGARAIAKSGVSAGEEALAALVFVLIASIGVVTPVAVYFAFGEQAQGFLDGLKDWLAENNAVIMAVLLLILGAKSIGDAVSILT
jgi:threonine/homoserine/homoserine lactone efflux protein